jgi:polysaccharide deacetylase 2 family uncharacterized protein YibQ
MVDPSTYLLRRWRPKGWVVYLLSFIIGSLMIILGYVCFTKEKPLSSKPLSQKVSPIDQTIQGRLPEIVTPKKDVFLHKPSGLRSKVVIVIDDLGSEKQIVQEFLHWDLPITFSILPFTPHSKTIALEAHRRGKDVILHLPMEPHGYPEVRPGKGVLLQEMDEESLLLQLSKDIEAVPHIKGVSNHMGSRLMEDPEKMKIIFCELKRRGLFFLDSRTTSQTVGLQTAHAIGLKAMERSLFIDYSSGAGDIRQKIEELTQRCLSEGKAIAIGHPHLSTLKTLKEEIPKMREKGIDIVPLSSLVE